MLHPSRSIRSLSQSLIVLAHSASFHIGCLDSRSWGLSQPAFNSLFSAKMLYTNMAKKRTLKSIDNLCCSLIDVIDKARTKLNSETSEVKAAASALSLSLRTIRHDIAQRTRTRKLRITTPCRSSTSEFERSLLYALQLFQIRVGLSLSGESLLIKGKLNEIEVCK